MKHASVAEFLQQEERDSAIGIARTFMVFSVAVVAAAHAGGRACHTLGSRYDQQRRYAASRRGMNFSRCVLCMSDAAFPDIELGAASVHPYFREGKDVFWNNVKKMLDVHAENQ